ncbi:MAG: hypothetical protein KTU85_08165 [Acidimicrobiia bacterium]|nr:hypothetical protein [Acidimicrobiia bacterium]MCY4457204.1 hypothetical protein [Acidimicrobiaceae bacterium]
MSDAVGNRLAFVENRAAPEGFRSGEGTDDEIVVRELVQNALDAHATIIRFSTISVPIEQVPDIDGYRDAFEAIHPDLRKTPVARAAIERIQRSLESGTVGCLLCTDNGSGLQLNDYQRLLAEAMSAKVGHASVGKLGSVGVGHLTALDASDMRYVLYASHGQDGPLFGGQTMLASQRYYKDGNEEHRVRQGCLTAASRVDDFLGYKASQADHEAMPMWLKIPPSRGTTVAILGYGSLDEYVSSQDEDSDLTSEPHLNRIFDAVAKHFMVALQNGKLRVSYASESRHEVWLDDEEIRRRLEANRHRRRASRRHYGSGARAWAAWETLNENNVIPYDGGSLWYRLTPGQNTTVVVFRNGMRITDDAPQLRSSDFKGTKAFSAVLDADRELASAIKECETDSHLEIKVSQAPKKQGELASKGLQEVQDALKSAVGELDTDEWVPDVLRIFDGHDMPSNLEPAPPRHRSPQLDSVQLEFPQVVSEAGTAPPGPGPTPGPGPGPGPVPADRPVQPQQWRPGSVEGVRRSFVPINDREAIIEWDFTGDARRPACAGVAVVIGSGSQPADRSPAPDQALLIRPQGTSEDQWAYELKVPANQGSIRVEVADVPSDWEAVMAVVSRRT